MSKLSIKAALLKSYPWVLVNIIGIGTYLYFTSKLWPLASERGLDASANTSISWITTAFPVFLVCSLINVIWFVRIIKEMHNSKVFQPIILWAFVIILWFVTFKIDQYHTYNGSEVSMFNSNVITEIQA